MMQWIRRSLVAVIMVMGVALALPVPAGAVNIFQSCSESGSDSAVCEGRSERVEPFIERVVNLLLFILGIIAVIVIIIAGIMYAVSAGDSSAVTKAKNAILYAIIGLVVALLSYAIVNLVVDRVSE